MIKRFIAFFVLAFTLLPVLAQIPAGYYSTADGKSGAELKTALYLIIKDHDALSYAGLWTAFETTDKKPNGKVWDMYSDNPGGTPPYEFTFGSDQCGNYSGENSCYNREHSFPKSWFSEATPMYSDLYHLYPTDGYVNGKRGNHPFGEVSSPTWTSMNGSKVGSCSYPGYSGTVFEPIDEYKGDFARSYFYMVTRYENVVMNWNSAMLDGSKYPAFTTWSKNMLIEWHRQDPVSQKELDRNNAIYNNFQHNRNPFIDHPEYAECIWASCSTDQPVSFTSSPITGANVGVSYSYSVTTTGGTVGSTRTVSCTEKPTWLTFSSTGNGAAILSGTPGAANLGTASVKLLVTDGTTSANQNFTITVSEVSANLTFTSLAVTSATAERVYTYSITATDSNNPSASVSISCSQKPAWLSFTSTGNGTATLTGTPASTDVGTHNVTLVATSGLASTNQSFVVTVSEASASNVETFTNIPASSSSYSSRSWTGDDGSTWTATNARTDQTINEAAICLKAVAGSYVQSGTLSGGVTSIQFKHKQAFTGGGGELTLYINGTQRGEPVAVTDVEGLAQIAVSGVSGDFVIKLESNGASRIVIDDVEWVSGSTSTNSLPLISNVSYLPVSPIPTEEVTVSATITDSDGTIASVVLLWGVAESNLTNEVAMTANGNIYSAVIPALNAEGIIYYRISATDDDGGLSQRAVSSISVVAPANELPVISEVSSTPTSPTPADAITVSATVTDSDGTIASVVLLWGVAESNITNEVAMTANGNVYSAAIPSQNAEGNVFFKIRATDDVDGVTQSAVSSISVVAPANELPVISEVSSTPTSPTITDAITITAAIADADGTIDAAYIMWGFAGEAMDNRVDLVLVQSTYTAQILATNRVGILEYRVYAEDDKGSVAQSSVHSITISGSDAENQIPVISAISNSPQNPTSNDNIVVSATITDSDGTIVSAYVDWGLTQDNLANRLSLTSSESVYSATIPALTTGGTVYYRLSAQDNDGGLVVTTVGSVVVSLVNTKPVLGNIEVSPETIEVNQSITITTEVTDAEDNITSVRIHWGTTASSLVNSVDMSLSEGKYQGTIPGIAEAGKYYFRVKASDVGSDITSSSALFFEVMPANTAPVISDVSFTPSAPKVNQPVAVSAVVVDNESNLNLVQLYWGTSSAAMVNAVNMLAGEGNSYSGSIPSQSEAATIHFYVKATDLRGEIATSQAQQFEVSVGSGIDDVERALDVKVYPNPAADKVVVETPASVIVSSVELFNLVGIRLSSLSIDAQQSVTTLSLSGVKSGVYIIRVVTDRGTVSKRLVVR
ncbi:MAG: endonuclease [Bacteroidales bacterium]|nr:endonuclease [Bacteroidales bacterium]MBN2748324.1 endonuclease [Bacteroidales bacterium]